MRPEGFPRLPFEVGRWFLEVEKFPNCTCRTVTAPQTFVETVDEDFLACLVVVLRDLFPSFHQWPYATAWDRDVVGHRCLVIFHRVLTLSPAFRASTVG